MAYLGFSCCYGFGLALLTSFAIWLSRRQNWMYPLSCPAWRPPRFPSAGASNWKSRNSTVAFVKVAW